VEISKSTIGQILVWVCVSVCVRVLYLIFRITCWDVETNIH